MKNTFRTLAVCAALAAAFAAPGRTEAASPLLPLDLEAGTLPNRLEFVGRDPKVAGRPDATEAGVGEGRRGFAFSLPGETEAADRGGGSAPTRASSHRFPPP